MTESSPGRTAPDRRLVFCPVTPGRTGTLAVWTGRLASGQRIGLAFTSPAALRTALGARQPWIRLSDEQCCAN